METFLYQYFMLNPKLRVAILSKFPKLFPHNSRKPNRKDINIHTWEENYHKISVNLIKIIICLLIDIKICQLYQYNLGHNIIKYDSRG